MKILITFISLSGNTKKVAEIVQANLGELGHEVALKNALTVKAEQVHDCDLLVIGTPIHGKILFGQKHADDLNPFLKNELPVDLKNKPVVIFSTYLFFPRKGLNKLEKKIMSNSGFVIAKLSERRSKKIILANKIIEAITTQT